MYILSYTVFTWITPDKNNKYVYREAQGSRCGNTPNNTLSEGEDVENDRSRFCRQVLGSSLGPRPAEPPALRPNSVNNALQCSYYHVVMVCFSCSLVHRTDERRHSPSLAGDRTVLQLCWALSFVTLLCNVVVSCVIAVLVLHQHI